MLRHFKRYTPAKIKSIIVWIRSFLLDGHAIKCYSQEGEDMILRRMFKNKQFGFYVDVGAHHPRRFSNTFYFYKLGWSGINIEPNPDAFWLFQMDRARDKNLQLGVSDSTSLLKYHWFDDPALNTFDEQLVNSRLLNTNYKVIRTKDIPVDRLDNILQKTLPNGQLIDFLSVDVEGLDLKVLRSNDWILYRPRCVLAEALNMSIDEVMKSDIVNYMAEQQYILCARTHNTLIFRENTIPEL